MCLSISSLLPSLPALNCLVIYSLIRDYFFLPLICDYEGRKLGMAVAERKQQDASGWFLPAACGGPCGTSRPLAAGLLLHPQTPAHPQGPCIPLHWGLKLCLELSLVRWQQDRVLRGSEGLGSASQERRGHLPVSPECGQGARGSPETLQALQPGVSHGGPAGPTPAPSTRKGSPRCAPPRAPSTAGAGVERHKNKGAGIKKWLPEPKKNTWKRARTWQQSGVCEDFWQVPSLMEIFTRRVINSPSGRRYSAFLEAPGWFPRVFLCLPPWRSIPAPRGARFAAGSAPREPRLREQTSTLLCLLPCDSPVPWQPPKAEEQGLEKAAVDALVRSGPGEFAAAAEAPKASAESRGSGKDSASGSSRAGASVLPLSAPNGDMHWASPAWKPMSSAAFVKAQVFPVCSVRWAKKRPDFRGT